MSFLAPTRGEILDRISIVSRRYVERKAAGAVNESQFAELSDLREALEKLGPAGYPDFLLPAVNAALWERENEIRREGQDKLAALTLEIAMLNDWRAKLIAEIDGLGASPKIHRS